MDITDKERELIDTQVFHEHCMDFRGATPETAHNHYQLMLKYVAGLLRSQLSSQWISVDDRLPPSNGRDTSKAIMVWCPEIMCCFSASYNFKDKCFEYFCASSSVIKSNVSHWQTMLEPPTL